MPVSSTHDNDNPLFSKPPRPASCANDDDPLLNNPIQPIGSFDTIDSNTRPTALARVNSRGTYPCVICHAPLCIIHCIPKCRLFATRGAYLYITLPYHIFLTHFFYLSSLKLQSHSRSEQVSWGSTSSTC